MTLRIIGGKYKGCTLYAPKGLTTRPTSDKTRQTIFDIFIHAPWFNQKKFIEMSVLDIFAGTGAMGLEMLSRGAKKAIFIEHDNQAIIALKKNIAKCHAEKDCFILRQNALKPSHADKIVDIICLDPPYRGNLINKTLIALMKNGWLNKHTLIIAETEKENTTFSLPATLLKKKETGAALLTFWTNYH